MSAYVDSASREFAAIARSYVDASPKRPQPAHFLAFCDDPTNRPRAQELFNRWLAIALRALGRPGTKGDERAVALYERATRVTASAEILFNLSQAYGQAIRLQEQDATLARAQALSPDVVTALMIGLNVRYKLPAGTGIRFTGLPDA